MARRVPALQTAPALPALLVAPLALPTLPPHQALQTPPPTRQTAPHHPLGSWRRSAEVKSHSSRLPSSASGPRRPALREGSPPGPADGPQPPGSANGPSCNGERPPPAQLRSMYGEFQEAMIHLKYKLIPTRKPEDIRGCGLLKYSNLLVCDFKPACEAEIKTLERYMCSRFFIDFPDVGEQQNKIESYLHNHFIGEEKSKYDYLMTLCGVVNQSTVCLIGHERRQTLNMITLMALKVLGEQNILPNTDNVTCFYQPAPYLVAEGGYPVYYVTSGPPPIFFQPYVLDHLPINLWGRDVLDQLGFMAIVPIQGFRPQRQSRSPNYSPTQDYQVPDTTPTQDTWQLSA
uniref:uncharacterized protein LOC143400327 n=1 Tax=Callospermophilus lateralis TaxID=76772 RepID=UPI00403875A3